MSKITTIKCDRCGEVLDGEALATAGSIRVDTGNGKVLAADICHACIEGTIPNLRTHVDFVETTKPGKKAGVKK